MAKIFGTIELPPNFANQLLSCEIQIQLNKIIPQQVVVHALQLYSKGMEYFQSIKSYKFQYFKRKMNNLLTQPRILQVMTLTCNNKQEQRQQTNIEQIDQSIRPIYMKRKYQKMYKQIIDKTSFITGQKIRSIVQQNQIKVNEVKQSIKGQLNQQQKRLQIKIERRKFKKDTKYMCSNIQKSTKQSLFNDSQHDNELKIEADFSQVINQDEYSQHQKKEQNQY